MANIQLTLTEAQFLQLLKETSASSWLYPILAEKAHSIEARKAYTAYRTAKTDDEKHEARMKYLKTKR